MSDKDNQVKASRLQELINGVFNIEQRGCVTVINYVMSSVSSGPKKAWWTAGHMRVEALSCLEHR